MSKKHLDDDQRVKEIVPPGKPLQDPKDKDIPVPPPPKKSPIKCGYYIALAENGDVRFDIVGSNQTAIELLGLNEIAREKINWVTDRSYGGKYSAITSKLDSQNKAINHATVVLSDLVKALSQNNEDKDT